MTNKKDDNIVNFPPKENSIKISSMEMTNFPFQLGAEICDSITDTHKKVYLSDLSDEQLKNMREALNKLFLLRYEYKTLLIGGESVMTLRLSNSDIVIFDEEMIEKMKKILPE